MNNHEMLCIHGIGSMFPNYFSNVQDYLTKRKKCKINTKGVPVPSETGCPQERIASYQLI